MSPSQITARCIALLALGALCGAIAGQVLEHDLAIAIAIGICAGGFVAGLLYLSVWTRER